VCTEFNECQESHESMPSIEMEEVQIASNSENEREGRNVNLGVEGSNANGKVKEMDKEGHMKKIIGRLQRHAQDRRADSQNRDR
jgi:hypothetical protein